MHVQEGMPLSAKEGETRDEILGGELFIFQKEGGYRFSLDALLLAHFVRLKKSNSMIDLGAGSGVLSIIIAKRCGCRKIVGIEIQDDLVEMSMRSVAANNLSDMIEIIRSDIRNLADLFEAGSFDAAVANPPYRRLHAGRINLDPQKAAARHEINGSLADFLAAADFVLKRGGKIFLIYPATRTAELFHRMKIARLEPKRLRIVHSKSGTAGEFALVEGIKGGREALNVLPPLFIYEGDGGYSDEMTAIFNDLSGPASP
jgi:tRNA1Val (adenine37-N6)-methyltransferase